MAVKIAAFTTAAKSVKKLAKKVAKAYTTNPEGRVRSGSGRSQCTAMCVLVSEDECKEPVCLEHPTKEMEMERLMKLEVQKVGVTGYEGKGEGTGGLRGGCLYESEEEDSEDKWNEKTLCEGYEGYANLSFEVEPLEEELYMEEMGRAGALYLAFEDMDDENDNDWKEMEKKMRTKLVERVEKWLGKVEALDEKVETKDKMEIDNVCSGDVASVFTVQSAWTGITCVLEVSEENGEVETWNWMKKTEISMKDGDAASVWDVSPEEELDEYFGCKKGKKVKVKVCA